MSGDGTASCSGVTRVGRSPNPVSGDRPKSGSSSSDASAVLDSRYVAPSPARHEDVIVNNSRPTQPRAANEQRVARLWPTIAGGALVGLFLLGVTGGEDSAAPVTNRHSGKPAAESTTPAPSAARTTTRSHATASLGHTTTTRVKSAHNAFRVVHVVDGDTVKVTRIAGGGSVTVRVLGIDTPETKDPRRGIGCFGPEASAWATHVLLNKHVTIRTDPTQDVRDRYGRLLAYIRLPNGADYSTAAARNGYAKYYLYDVPVARAAQIAAAERAARAAGKGLWGPPCHGNTEAPPTSPSPAEPAATEPGSQAGYYANCDAARAAGVAPVHAGEPGYGRHLDRDGDGTGCE